jgi:predicted TIM-barrel fold metal-dependent hydrolase
MATNDRWLALGQEATLEPDLPICDPHHHLWDQRYERVEPRYLLDEILADVNRGHRIVSTVFIQCGAMHRAAGPEAMRPVGETEFVNGIAAMSASGLYGPMRIAAGIVGTADLTLGEAVAPVLEAHLPAGGGRFRGIRHIAAWDAAGTTIQPRAMPAPQLYLDATFRQGFAQLGRYGMSFEG